ncbi:inter-alpha-trypsin inhibitor heavy chain H4-like isoform X1 [Pararge aegeria]|uniref:inter-alpha-trypsin inhibitor heavy chain H4-like isoform X1 n=1 Tax=Pararge aegeria TaxID=116150 RepID=UPI0019CF5787|nr:inter-alpha-trypsin inhibitor heavy chain H4-like isoform X1 [Pararge aegeria]
MKPRTPMIALCICVIAASAYSAALQAQKEHIMIASGRPRERRKVGSTPRPLEPIELTEMRVRSEVALRYARTSVITHVHNPDTRPQEASFHMLLPDTAFISGFTMLLAGQSYNAYVKEKEEAKLLYTQAVSQGIGAAHVATKARDSNHFIVTVNVEGNTTAVFELRYEDFLVSRNGLYSHVINLHPGALVPTMEVVVHIKESQKITKLRVPEVRTGNEMDATQTDSQNSKVVIQNGSNKREVTITFTPDMSEQRRLAQIYMDKSKDASSLALGQFVVEYDVERSNNGEILVNDGYFVHFLAPTSLPPLSKHVVFVLDTSGSMLGRKIEQLRKAMDTILSDLKPTDYFNVVEFSHFVKVHELKEADEPAPTHRPDWYYNTISTDNSYTLVRPALASPDNIAKAKIIVSRLDYTGGTNIYSALDAAIGIIKKGVDKENTTNSNVALKTEKKKKAELEPIIIFLTDGVPLDGETNTDRITSLITEKNAGDMRAALYTIAFGEDADRVFLRKLSLRNEGFMRHIYEAADASLQLHDFYLQVASPLLSHVQFLYPAKQIKEGSVSRNKFRSVNSGSEVAVVGQIAEDAIEITPQIFGFYGSEDGLSLKRYEVTSKVTFTHTKDEHLPLERLWAYITIKQMLDQRDAADDRSEKQNSPEKKALAIALKYAFVTPLTSLVVVKPNETNAVDVDSTDAMSIITTTPEPTSNAAQPSYDWEETDLEESENHSGLTRTIGGFGGQANLMYNMETRRPKLFVPASITTTKAPTTASNVNYHLEAFKWTSSIFNSSTGALTVLVENGTPVILQLTTDVDLPKAYGGDGECSNSTSTFAVGANENASNVCVYLTRCYAARSITADDYKKSYCIVNNR